MNERRQQDVEKINRIAQNSGGKIKIISVKGNPTNEIEIDLHYQTVASRLYPAEVSKTTRVNIELSSRYPFQEPLAMFKTTVFHPNVYTSGRICLGTKWLPTEGLDLLLKRIVQIITFDPQILNGNSPANREALSWYQSAIRQYPKNFPTDILNWSGSTVVKTLSWNALK